MSKDPSSIIERSSLTDTKGSINLRIESNTRQLIDDAAAILGKTRTEFTVEAARLQAIDVLLDQRLFVLDSKRYDAFLHALVSNWISAASRLVPLGQTDSQRVLVKLEAAVATIANRALNATLDDLGSATFRADLASLRHETQYTRLFRS